MHYVIFTNLYATVNGLWYKMPVPGAFYDDENNIVVKYSCF